VKQRKGLPGQLRVWVRSCGVAGLLVVAAGGLGWGQQTGVAVPASSSAPTESVAGAVHELQEQVSELRSVVAEMRSESAAYRAETAELRRELQATREQLAASGALPQPATSPEVSVANDRGSEDAKINSKAQASSVESRMASLEDSTQLLSGKVDEQYQTKVESASKYRVRLSGLVLMNLFSNRGGETDNQDFPSYASAPDPIDHKGNFGATLRQSEFGLEVFGPRLAGAKTMANLQADFAGGFPNTPNGINTGLFRLRIASMRMDWERTSIVVGQDSLFLTPRAPTSFASLAIPALAYAGDLWGWIPQVRVEHRFDIEPGQNVTVQAGILDNLTGEPPLTRYGRLAQAGERSSQPGLGARVAWSGTVLDRSLTVATAGYYSRQDWTYNRHLDGWAGMTDWDIALMPRVSLSGEFYRGRAIGGFGGGIGRSVVFSGNPVDPNTRIRGLDSIGGWSQLKFKATDKLEFNGAFGLDNPFSADVRAFPVSQSYVDPTLVRNRGALLNFVYRPRSDLLFSAEFHHLKTSAIDNDNYAAQQVNLVMGILF
jgi:hypothetical protein